MRTIKEKIFPTDEQKRKIRQMISCCHFVYNYMLSEKLWREIKHTMGLHRK
ncbi:MAG: helix-turn-helix domain-containing protein [Clostridiales bacterium]|nr:helix-turn-helix domain-containing protein [Clostridiales bacterium]